MLCGSKKRSANAAPLGVDRRKAESFYDTCGVNPDAHFAPRERKELRIAAHPMTTQFSCVTSRVGAVKVGRL
jgi:hypothetical protein